MPEVLLPMSNKSETWGQNAASTTATTVSAHLSANTKGSYTELTAATSFDANWIMVRFGNMSSGGLSFLVDIGIGSATEQIILPDLYVHSRSTGCGFAPYLFPIFIPKGSRLAARCQCSTGSSTVAVEVVLFSGTPISGGALPSFASAYGAVASSIGTQLDPGATAHTDTSWTELTAATERDHNWLAISARWGDGGMSSPVRWLLDIGIGSSTEQEIVSDLLVHADSTMDQAMTAVIYFPYFVPAGSRISVRVRASVTTSGDRTITMKLYGV